MVSCDWRWVFASPTAARLEHTDREDHTKHKDQFHLAPDPVHRLFKDGQPHRAADHPSPACPLAAQRVQEKNRPCGSVSTELSESAQSPRHQCVSRSVGRRRRKDAAARHPWTERPFPSPVHARPTRQSQQQTASGKPTAHKKQSSAQPLLPPRV